MKLPIQAQPVSRTVSSTMLAKKATNAVGASWSCSECALSFVQCGWAAMDGPKPFRDCLVGLGAEGCADCNAEVVDWIIRNGGGGGRERPLPPGFGRDIF